MAPLLLLFLLGGLCALFSLRTRGGKKCDDGGGVKSHATKCGADDKGEERGEKEGKEEETKQGTKVTKAPAPDAEADLGIVFSTFDHDGDGFITARELEESLRRLCIAVSADEAAAMVDRVDANADGLIDIHEFRELYDSIPKKRRQQHPASAAAVEPDAKRAVVVADDTEEEAEEEEERDLREAFDVFDGNKDGLISAEELGTVLGSLGLRRNAAGRPVTATAAAECRDMIRLVDADGDGMVNFEEFKRMMTVVKA